MLTRQQFGFPELGWRNPILEMDRMRRDMDLLSAALLGTPEVRRNLTGVFPALNLTENKDNYYLRAEIPGIKSEDIDIQVTGKNLAISGERKEVSEQENVKYHRRECGAGKFSRVITFPGEINADRIEAQVVNGVLTVTAPKSEAAKPKQIAVK